MTCSRRLFIRRLSASSDETSSSSSSSSSLSSSRPRRTSSSSRSSSVGWRCDAVQPGNQPANSSDYEQVSESTLNLGTVSLRELSFSNRQMVRSQHKSGDGLVMLVTHRNSASLYYVLLRMNSWWFWSFVLAVQVGLVSIAAAYFFALQQPKGTALRLALDVNGLAVVDVECVAIGDASWGCRTGAAFLSLLRLVASLFVGGVIVVRLSRVVAKHRFEFSRIAVIHDGELVIRLFSNRPSMVIMPSFRLEYFDDHGRARSLPLVNGGSIAYLHDTALLLRHAVKDGPFGDPNWRSHVRKVRISVMGFDELLAQDVSGCFLYHTCDIRDDVEFDDLISRGKIKLGRDDLRSCLFMDMNKLNAVVPKAAPPPAAAAAKPVVVTTAAAAARTSKTNALVVPWYRRRPCWFSQRLVRRLGPRGASLVGRGSLESIDVSAEDDDLSELEPRGAPTIDERKRRPEMTRELSVAAASMGLGEFADHRGDEKAVKFSSIDYASRQSLLSLMDSKTTAFGLMMLVINRKHRIPWHYLFLRMSPSHFWCVIVLFSVVITCLGAVVFYAAGRQDISNSILLSLAGNGLAVGDVYCDREDYGGGKFGRASWPCHAVGAATRLLNFICELFFGAIIIVRLSRVVVQNRFEFANFCVLDTDDGELIVRLVSNRPSTVVMPTFQLEYMDVAGKRLHPLELTNGGTVAYLADSTFFLRHKIDRKSPFSSPRWRDTVLGVRIAVVGFDELLAQEACGCRFYASQDIKTDVDYGNMVSTGHLKFRNVVHAAYFVDMLKLNDERPKERSHRRDHYQPPPDAPIAPAKLVPPRLRRDTSDPPALDLATLGLPSLRGPLRRKTKQDRGRFLKRLHTYPVILDDDLEDRDDDDDIEDRDDDRLADLPRPPLSPLARVSLGVLHPSVDDEPLQPKPLRVAYSHSEYSPQE